MLRFFFGGKKAEEAKVETQREGFIRVLGELNDLIGGLDPKPAVTVDPATGRIELRLPKQLPDEALALPAPKEAKPAPKAEPKPEPKAEAKPEAKPAPKPEAKPEAKAEAKPEATTEKPAAKA
ncbi:hypothetical protein IV417_06395 [Alphaproteobacteria bacterium KMM 3653]|uniref:Uncharacterized protein n=1 Tax=Harenicola maris TaxID=2841044 RepID=A0AAP2CR30_9RHOB|nr:hypothetical protein [Harenicola maris]